MNNEIVRLQPEVNNEVHMFVVKDQGHPQNIEFMQICRSCQGSCTMWGMCLVQKICSAFCGRRRIGVSVVSP
jgi:hypothetical protein